MPELDIYNADDVVQWLNNHPNVAERKNLFKKLYANILWNDYSKNQNEMNDDDIMKVAQLQEIRLRFIPYIDINQTLSEFSDEDNGLYLYNDEINSLRPPARLMMQRELMTATHYKDIPIQNGGGKRKQKNKKNKRSKTNKKVYRKKGYKKRTRKHTRKT